MIKNVVFIGAGNLATQLGQALFDSGINIVQVYSRTTESAQSLAGKVNASYTTDLATIKKQCDLYIIAVKDDVLKDLASQIDFGNKMVVHTAGSVDLQVLSDYTSNYGVFYPFQTFSKSKKVDFSKVPICLEANSPDNYKKLEDLAKKISYKVIKLSSEQRQFLHVAAVFSCNFANHMYALSDLILKDKEMKLELLYPLIQETTEKAMKMDPAEAQTGPSVRNDQEIIQKHLDLLNDKPEMQEIYRLMSDSIYKLHYK